MLWTIKYLGRKEGIELRKEIYLYVSSSQKHLWEVVHKTPNMRMFLSVPLALYWTAEWLSEHQGIATAPASGHYTSPIPRGTPDWDWDTLIARIQHWHCFYLIKTFTRLKGKSLQWDVSLRCGLEPQVIILRERLLITL